MGVQVLCGFPACGLRASAFSGSTRNPGVWVSRFRAIGSSRAGRNPRP